MMNQYKLIYRLITPDYKLGEIIEETFDDLVTARTTRKIEKLRNMVLWSYIIRIDRDK